MLEETIIKVDLSVITFMKKIGDQYQIYEYIGKNKKIDPIELVNLFSKNMGDDFSVNIIGSRAYGINLILIMILFCRVMQMKICLILVLSYLRKCHHILFMQNLLNQKYRQ